MKNIKYILLSAVLVGFTACNDEADFEDQLDNPTVEVVLPELTAGDADFSKYIAVGASFSGGFTDNALFISGQENSFPNLLSQKFALLGGGDFTQPLMNDNIGGFVLGTTVVSNPRLYFNGSGPAVLPATPTTQITDVLTGDFNNYGIPGAKSFHLGIAGYGTLNPYFGRMASSPGATILGDAVAQNPTFFTLSEIGGNDVLSYATSGGVGVDQTGNFDPTTYGTNDITDPNVFAASFNASVDALTANGAKGVVANLPYITSLAHFTTVPYNPVPLDAATAAALNQGYAAYNGGLQQAFAALDGTGLFTAEELAQRTISFSESATNALVIIDETLTDLGAINPAFAGIPQYRQATADDLFVLPLSSLIPQGYGTQIPLEDKWALIPSEQLALQTATDAYNATIEAVAASKGLALVDFKSILQQASTTGFQSGNFILTTDLVTGGLVSLDGVHLTSRGYALMANEMMKAIDLTYGSNFEASGNLIDAGEYPTNYPPTLQ
ncbi:G-D-S-L family lipolytic protein [uncultured Winogradskyella sp.]|uniref:G-D-S-L family lipolytic protein n=1 Tax=uncultured Winogradskyella sp. TaxID=395353 RepID=UPI0026394740|nr:G-D-S-L family lipolytic protein [uncultured Winogradskyella sp.]|tara:strand:- start:185 stop:1678 length:1494 start_codon:yes stop_codon:yes gene_type:complete